MHLSWSHKLFLKINAQIGTYPRLDRIMYFCGFWLIGVMALSLLILFVVLFFESTHWALSVIKIFCAVGVLSYSMSYFIAFLWPHKRPLKELPLVKNLFHPLGNWKSFPSDHTIAATVFALVAFFATGSWILGIYFGTGALLVALGRVYGGVHYPRDIVGGALIAVLSFVTVLFILYTQ